MKSTRNVQSLQDLIPKDLVRIIILVRCDNNTLKAARDGEDYSKTPHCYSNNKLYNELKWSYGIKNSTTLNVNISAPGLLELFTDSTG